MLVKQEKIAYTIANASITNSVIELEGEKYLPCHACNGTGLLPHPTEYMHIATCYVCEGTGINSLIKIEKMAQKFDKC